MKGRNQDPPNRFDVFEPSVVMDELGAERLSIFHVLLDRDALVTRREAAPGVSGSAPPVNRTRNLLIKSRSEGGSVSRQDVVQPRVRVVR
jgi:hypothetical protein